MARTSLSTPEGYHHMAPLTLIIGNRTYSSWSLRAWIFMKHAGVSFEEIVIPLDTPQTREQLERHGPSGRVPVLHHGELRIWDSLAICEYVAEVSGNGWPQSREARAVARAVSAEMHSGFTTLRSLWPMNARARNRHTAVPAALTADIERIDELWNDCRSRFGDGGPWLFGSYSVADAMYAPVVLRFNTYGAHISQTARWYMASTLEDAPLQEWLQAAKQETWTIATDEVG
jgi:glutathione S-transferase